MPPYSVHDQFSITPSLYFIQLIFDNNLLLHIMTEKHSFFYSVTGRNNAGFYAISCAQFFFFLVHFFAAHRNKTNRSPG